MESLQKMRSFIFPLLPLLLHIPHSTAPILPHLLYATHPVSYDTRFTAYTGFPKLNPICATELNPEYVTKSKDASYCVFSLDADDIAQIRASEQDKTEPSKRIKSIDEARHVCQASVKGVWWKEAPFYNGKYEALNTLMTYMPQVSVDIATPKSKEELDFIVEAMMSDTNPYDNESERTFFGLKDGEHSWYSDGMTEKAVPQYLDQHNGKCAFFIRHVVMDKNMTLWSPVYKIGPNNGLFKVNCDKPFKNEHIGQGEFYSNYAVCAFEQPKPCDYETKRVCRTNPITENCELVVRRKLVSAGHPLWINCSSYSEEIVKDGHCPEDAVNRDCLSKQCVWGEWSADSPHCNPCDKVVFSRQKLKDGALLGECKNEDSSKQEVCPPCTDAGRKIGVERSAIVILGVIQAILAQ